MSALEATNLITASVWDRVGLKLHFKVKWKSTHISDRVFIHTLHTYWKHFPTVTTELELTPKPAELLSTVIFICTYSVTEISWQGAWWDRGDDVGTVQCLCVIITGCEGRGEILIRGGGWGRVSLFNHFAPVLPLQSILSTCISTSSWSWLWLCCHDNPSWLARSHAG